MRSRMLVILALVALAAPAAVSAQEYGDGVGIGGVFLPSGSTTLVGKTRIGDEVGIEVELAFATEDDDRGSETDFGLGVGLLKYWNAGNEVQPFVGGRVGVGYVSYDYGEQGGEGDDTDFVLAAVLGAEYFVNRRLSIEGEADLRLVFGSFGMSTGTRLGAFLYL